MGTVFKRTATKRLPAAPACSPLPDPSQQTATASRHGPATTTGGISAELRGQVAASAPEGATVFVGIWWSFNPNCHWPG